MPATLTDAGVERMYRREPRSAEIAREEERRRRMMAEGSERFVRAHWFLKGLKRKYMDGWISWQQFRTIRGQAVSGDLEGAVKGLNRIINGDGGEG